MDIFQRILAEPWSVYIFQLFLTCTAVVIVKISMDKLSNHQTMRHRSLIFQITEEFVCVWQTIVVSNENGIIRLAYGIYAYAAAVYCCALLYMKLFHTSIKTNPIASIDSYSYSHSLPLPGEKLHHPMPWNKLATQLIVQFAAAWVSYKYLVSFWSISGIDPAHKQAEATLHPCVSHITVPLVNAVLVESAISFLFRFIIHAEHRYHHGLFLVPVGAVMCTLIGLPFTGGHFNPALAFVVQYGCQAHNNLDFWAVYCLGPAIAAYLVGIYGETIWQHIFPGSPRRLHSEVIEEHPHRSDAATAPAGQEVPRSPHEE